MAVLLASFISLGASARSVGLDEIRALADRGRAEEALRRLDGLRLDESEQLEGRLLRGVLLAELGRENEAERAFRRLSLESPDRPEPIHNLAVLQAMGGRPATAVLALEGLLDRYPAYEEAALNLERIRRGVGGNGLDPLRGDSARIALALTSRLGAFATPERTEPPPPTPAPSTIASQPRELPSSPIPEGVEPPAAAKADPHVPVPTLDQGPAAPAALPSEPMLVQAPEPGLESEAPAPKTEPERELRAELESVIRAWAEAWSQQRLREYLDFYSADFQAAGFASREAWESVRRRRLATPSFIEVTVELDSMTLRELSPGEAAVTFVQSYSSDRHNDVVEKTLVFVHRDGAWRISRETSE